MIFEEMIISKTIDNGLDSIIKTTLSFKSEVTTTITIWIGTTGTKIRTIKVMGATIGIKTTNIIGTISKVDALIISEAT